VNAIDFNACDPLRFLRCEKEKRPSMTPGPSVAILVAAK